MLREEDIRSYKRSLTAAAAVRIFNIAVNLFSDTRFRIFMPLNAPMAIVAYSEKVCKYQHWKNYAD